MLRVQALATVLSDVSPENPKRLVFFRAKGSTATAIAGSIEPGAASLAVCRLHCGSLTFVCMCVFVRRAALQEPHCTHPPLATRLDPRGVEVTIPGR
jgi:hypothetical protein